MVEIKPGDIECSQALPDLIFASAKPILEFLFQSKQSALAYLHSAAIESDGQFSAFRHHFACLDGQAVGTVSLWHTELTPAFHLATYQSLQKFLSAELFMHVLAVNPQLIKAFPPPLPNQLCFGHLAVNKDFHGQNIGSKLIAFVMRQAKAMGKTQVALDVHAENVEAISFYRRWDFIEQNTCVFAPLNQQYLRMIKNL